MIQQPGGVNVGYVVSGSCFILIDVCCVLLCNATLSLVCTKNISNTYILLVVLYLYIVTHDTIYS